MEEKTGAEIFLEHIPALSVWYKALCTYLAQLLIFVFVLFFFWLISSQVWMGAILGQLIVSTLLVFYFVYLAKKSDRIQKKYRKKYDKLAGQKFWYYYQSCIIPVISAAFFFPLLIITYDFDFPTTIIRLQPHFINNSLFPFYIAIPLGIIIIFIGFLIRRSSKGDNIDVDNYFYLIYPEKGKLITDDIYQYIRNPQYLCRGIIAVGFGIFANNISAILVGLIHFLSYCAIIPAEDEELTQRFGDDFLVYKKKVPALIPRYGNWKKFFKSGKN